MFYAQTNLAYLHSFILSDYLVSFAPPSDLFNWIDDEENKSAVSVETRETAQPAAWLAYLISHAEVKANEERTKSRRHWYFSRLHLRIIHCCCMFSAKTFVGLHCLTISTGKHDGGGIIAHRSIFWRDYTRATEYSTCATTLREYRATRFL